jgi:hypothetical protein
MGWLIPAATVKGLIVLGCRLKIIFGCVIRLIRVSPDLTLFITLILEMLYVNLCW